MVSDERAAGLGRVEVQACAGCEANGSVFKGDGIYNKLQRAARARQHSCFSPAWSIDLRTPPIKQRSCTVTATRHKRHGCCKGPVFLKVGLKLQPLPRCVISVLMWGRQSVCEPWRDGLLIEKRCHTEHSARVHPDHVCLKTYVCVCVYLCAQSQVTAS